MFSLVHLPPVVGVQAGPLVLGDLVIEHQLVDRLHGGLEIVDKIDRNK